MQILPFDPAIDDRVNQLLDQFDADPDLYFKVRSKIRDLLPGSDYFDLRALAPDTADRLDSFLD